MVFMVQGENPYEDAVDILKKKLGLKKRPTYATIHGQLHEPLAMAEYKKGIELPAYPSPLNTLTPPQPPVARSHSTDWCSTRTGWDAALMASPFAADWLSSNAPSPAASSKERCPDTTCRSFRFPCTYSVWMRLTTLNGLRGKPTWFASNGTNRTSTPCSSS